VAARLVRFSTFSLMSPESAALSLDDAAGKPVRESVDEQHVKRNDDDNTIARREMNDGLVRMQPLVL